MSEAEALIEVANAINRLQPAVIGIAVVLWLMLLFKKMG